MDPIEIRRKNLLAPDALPHKTAMGLDIDSGDFPHLFERTLEKADPGTFADRAERAKQAGRLFGFAISPYLECTGGGPKEFAGVTFSADGSLALAVGSQSTGMGYETSMPQLLAARLGIEFGRVQFTQADTDATPIGGGHGGSRGMEWAATPSLKRPMKSLKRPPDWRLICFSPMSPKYRSRTVNSALSPPAFRFP